MKMKNSKILGHTFSKNNNGQPVVHIRVDKDTTISELDPMINDFMVEDLDIYSYQYTEMHIGNGGVTLTYIFDPTDSSE